MVKKVKDEYATRLEDHIYFEYQRSRVVGNQTDRAGTLHVSDVKSDCMRNVYYGKKDNSKSMTTEQFKPLFLGQAIHGFTQIAKPEYHEITLAYDYVNDTKVDLEEWKEIVPLSDPRWYNVLIGSIDDLLEFDGQYVICDKKTTGAIEFFKKTKAVNATHKIQLNHYRVLLKKCMDIDASWGSIVYIATKNLDGKVDMPVITSTTLDPIEDTLESIKKNGAAIKDAMVNGVIPPKVRNWLCDGYCSYATKCFVDDRTHE